MRSSYHKINSIINNKLWGCLAESVNDVDRYDKYANGKHKRFSLREYWMDSEIDRFIKKIFICFNQQVIIMRKDTINDVYNQLKKVIDGNLSRL